MKTSIFSITLLLFLPLAASAQTADEIVKKALDARGGVDKLKAVQSERITGRISFARDVEGAFVVELKRPMKMHVEILLEGQKIIRVYDGKSSGWMINPLAETKEVQPLTSEELKNIADESDFDGPLVDYKTKGNRIELAGKENLDDKPVYRLKLTKESGDVRFYFFDASSFLLLKWEGIRKTGEQELPWESFFSDFREVQGPKSSRPPPPKKWKSIHRSMILTSPSHRVLCSPRIRLHLHPHLLHPLPFRTSGFFCWRQGVIDPAIRVECYCAGGASRIRYFRYHGTGAKPHLGMRGNRGNRIAMQKLVPRRGLHGPAG